METMINGAKRLWNNSYFRVPFFSIFVVISFFVLPVETRNVFVPAVIGFFLSNLITSLVNSYKNSREDKVKSKQDGSFLKKVYYEEDVKKVPIVIDYNGLKREVYFKTIIDSPKKIIFEHKPEMFMLDDLFSTFYFDILKSHSNSYIKNVDTLRLYDIDSKKDDDGETTYILKTQKTNYFDHLLTNRAIDYPIRGSASLRHIYEPGPVLRPLSESSFANQIGFNCMVILSDHTIIIPRRSKNATYSKDKVTASLTGRLPVSLKTGSTEKDLELFVKKQAKEKLGINEKYLNSDVEFKICSIVQDIYEGGKPQIYFTLKLNTLSSLDYFKERGSSLINRCDPYQLDRDIRFYVTNLGDIKFVGRKDKISINSKYDKKGRVRLKPEKSFYLCLSYTQKYKVNEL
ncbi:MAG: hypothetical protein KKH92_09700 [Firmicutes bacterium]|nr:hypothetical protein [Bacillota bacterium]